MQAKGTWVALFYLAATLIVSLVFSLAYAELFTFFRTEDTLLFGSQFTASQALGLMTALGIAVYAAFLNQSSKAFVEQCIVELDKVAWPSLPETRSATFTVIVTSLIASIILGLFDSLFGWLTAHNLFLG